MATTTTFEATAPDGTILTRTSKTRHYAYAVIGRTTGGAWYDRAIEAGASLWGAYRWSGTRENAEKAVAEFRRDYADTADLHVVEARVQERPSKNANENRKAARAATKRLNAKIAEGEGELQIMTATHKGQTYRLYVKADRFVTEDAATFTSLSGAAKHITGYETNGRKFWKAQA